MSTTTVGTCLAFLLLKSQISNDSNGRMAELRVTWYEWRGDPFRYFHLQCVQFFRSFPGNVNFDRSGVKKCPRLRCLNYCQVHHNVYALPSWCWSMRSHALPRITIELRILPDRKRIKKNHRQARARGNAYFTIAREKILVSFMTPLKPRHFEFDCV